MEENSFFALTPIINVSKYFFPSSLMPKTNKLECFVPGSIKTSLVYKDMVWH